MRRDTLVMIWIGGLVLAAAIYVVGPDQFLDVCLTVLDLIDDWIRRLVLTLGAQIFGVVRALAIALYVVFAVLAFLAAQRGRRGIWALIVVTVTFLMLVWRPYSEFPVPVGRWVIAFTLALVAAIVMTQRLLAPPPGPGGPYGGPWSSRVPPPGPRP